MRNLVIVAIGAVLSAMSALPLCAQEPKTSSDLYSRFMDPPKEYRPQVWWHWMNGNITLDGIRKDIEWMDRAGIAGFHNFDAGMATPQVVDQKLIYMTPEWKEAFNFALDLADSLGMEVTVASSPGWSITGGPWVTPEDAEKKVTWKSFTIEGGKPYNAPLPEPYTNCGPFQNILGFPDEPHKYEYYKDLFVLAVRLPGDGEEDKEYKAEFPEGDVTAHATWTFDRPMTMRSLSFQELTESDVSLEADRKGDGRFETIVPEILCSAFSNFTLWTYDFPETTAWAFRISNADEGWPLIVRDARISPAVRVNFAEDKAGFFTNWHISDHYPTPDAGQVPKVSDVIDLTGKVKDGILEWDVPEGIWKVWRFGYNLLGRQNGPASPEATGLEVDKLDAGAVWRYYDNYLKMYQEASGGRLGTAINSLMIDSYESGKGTWTKDMEREFRKRRGYDLRPWMPVLTGQVLDSAERSEQFLFDWRQTLGELIAENHYDIVNDILKQYGMKRYTEAHERRMAFVGDGMRVKRDADIPMSTIWVHYDDEVYSSYPVGEADIRESSSVAHIYGQNVCAAESFTVNGTIGKFDGFRAYQCGPFNLKRLADAAMAEGQNLFVIHTSVHQPSDSLVPGLALGPYGQYFNRHDTWAEEARGWTDYLSRSSYLMRQGRWAADIAWFYGEDKNLTKAYYLDRVKVPKGYNYDFVNSDALLHELRINKGCLTTGSGMRYRALVIDSEVKYMSLPVLKRIWQIAKAGVPVYGPKHVNKAGIQGSEKKFRRIADQLWNSGKYLVISDMPLDEALSKAGISKDADWHTEEEADIRFVHRHLDDGELYWVANITPSDRELTVSFAVNGKEPEIWHADTGVREKPTYRIVGDRTEVVLDMVPDDAQFILFTKPTDEGKYDAPARKERVLTTLEGPWHVSFQQGRGAPDQITMPALRSLSKSSVDGIRYFSGTATYRKTFEATREMSGNGDIILDLGEVHHMARVFLNGQDLGLAWKTPYRLPAGSALREGANELEIRVTDSWANRLIGDAWEWPEDRLTYTVVTFYTPEDEPIPSGLVGPVRLISKQ